ncbi:MAG: hypothetical protein AABX59_01250, partial [Nanoarchaeota archaeon]
GNQQGTPRVAGYNLINHKWGTLRDYTPNISSKITKELASLLAILFTDACVSPKGKSSWRISFVVSSDILINLFKECIMNIFFLSKKRVRIGRTKDGFFRAIVDSKEIGKYLVNRFGTFRTLRYKTGELPDTKLPLKRLIKNNVVGEFLKVAFSCDGGLCFYPAKREGARGGTRWLIRTVFLTCHHPKLREDYMILLQSLGIQARNVSKDGKIKIEKEEYIRRFYKLVGFVKGVKVTKHSKFWKNYEKQSVLNLLISSYKNPSLTYNLPKFYLK